jgi:peroxidase
LLLQLRGPNYAVELGRLDGKTFNRAIVKHVLPGPGFDLDQLNALFAQNGLTQTDMVALSGVHACSTSIFFSFYPWPWW